jgi:hypothetical protein
MYLKGYDAWKTACPPEYCDRCGGTIPDGTAVEVNDDDSQEEVICRGCNDEDRDEYMYG